MAGRLRFPRFKCVNLAVNLVQLIAVRGVSVDAATGSCDRLKGIDVQRILPRCGGIPDGNRMNDNAFVLGDLCALGGWHLTRCIVAVGQRDEHAVLGWTALEHIDRQTKRIAKSGLWSRHLYLRFVKQLSTHFQVLGERRLNKGRASKKDQTDAIAFAPG